MFPIFEDTKISQDHLIDSNHLVIFPLSSFILVLTFQIAAAGLADILEETDIPSTWP